MTQDAFPFAPPSVAAEWHRVRALLRLRLAALELQCHVAGMNLRQTEERTAELRDLIAVAERRYREACA